MKRFLFLLLVTILVGSAGYVLVVRPTGADLLELVPLDSVAVVDWNSPATSYQAFMDTPLGDKLQMIDWPLILSTLGLSTEEVTEMENIAASWNEFSNSLFFREFLGNRSVLALLPATGDEQGSFVIQRNNLIFLNKSGRKTTLLQSVFTGLPGTQRLPDRKYQGYTIHGYLLKNAYPIYFVTDKDLLIAAFEPVSLQQCLDLLLARILQKGGGMASNPDYLELKQRARGLDDFFLYVDLAPLKPWLQKSAAQDRAGRDEGVSSTRSVERGVQQAVLYHQPLQPIHQFTSIFRFDDSVLTPFQKRIYMRPPIEDQKLANMPANLLVYFWSNWLDLPAWWQATKANGSSRDIERADRLAELVQKYMGMSIESFLGLFGWQIGLDIKEIKSSGFFPVPRICFCIEMTDRERMQTLIEKFITGLPVHRDMVAGVPVVSVQAAGGLMQPSYALLNEYLIIADGRDQIEDILQPTEAVLIREPDFREVDMGLQQQNNLVFFARTAQLIDGLKELASWLGTIIAIRDERAGAKSKILIDQAIIPLLDGLTMVKAKAVRSYTGQGEIVLQSTLLMADNK